MQTLPDTRFVPATQSTPAGHARATAHFLGQHLTGNTRAQDEQNALQGGAIGDERSATSWLGRRRWQQWLDNRPEFIGYDLISHTENLGRAEAAFKVLKGTLNHFSSIKTVELRLNKEETIAKKVMNKTAAAIGRSNKL